MQLQRASLLITPSIPHSSKIFLYNSLSIASSLSLLSSPYMDTPPEETQALRLPSSRIWNGLLQEGMVQTGLCSWSSAPLRVEHGSQQVPSCCPASSSVQELHSLAPPLICLAVISCCSNVQPEGALQQSAKSQRLSKQLHSNLEVLQGTNAFQDLKSCIEYGLTSVAILR